MDRDGNEIFMDFIIEHGYNNTIKNFAINLTTS